MPNCVPTKAVMTATLARALMLAVTVFTPQGAKALPAYAARTGLACGQCHVDPGGGGPRNAFGRAFARNGHQIPGKGRWASPGVRQRPGDGYDHPGYRGYDGYGMGPGMMGPYRNGMGGGMMGGYGR